MHCSVLVVNAFDAPGVSISAGTDDGVSSRIGRGGDLVFGRLNRVFSVHLWICELYAYASDWKNISYLS